MTEEATRCSATLVFPTEADRSEASLLGVGRGIGRPWVSWSGGVGAPSPLHLFPLPNPPIRPITAYLMTLCRLPKPYS